MKAVFLLTFLVPSDWLPPPVSDLLNFPPQAVAVEQLRMAADHWEQVNSALHSGIGDIDVLRKVRAQLEDARQRWAAWETLRWIYLHGRESDRRHFLGELRHLLGPERYYAGRMPDPHGR